MKIKLEREDGYIFNAILNDKLYDGLRTHLLSLEFTDKLGIPCCECCERGCNSNPKNNHLFPCLYCQKDGKI